MKMTKRILSLLLCLTLISSIMANLGAGLFNASAQIDITNNTIGEREVPEVSIVVPEVIYLKPGTATFDRYMNGGITPGATSSDTGIIRFALLNGVTVDEGTSITFQWANASSIVFTDSTSSPSSSLQKTITGGQAVTATQSSLITWEFLYRVDGVDYTAYAYTYVYASYLGQAGAQIAVKRAGDSWLGIHIYKDYGINSYGFVTGVHSVGGGNYKSNFLANTSKKTGNPRNTAPLYAHYTLGEWSGTSGYVPDGDDESQGGDASSTTSGLTNGIHTNTAYFIPLDGGGVRLGGYVTGGETTMVGDTNPATAYITVDISRHTNLSQIPYLSAGVMQFYYTQCVEIDLSSIQSTNGEITTGESVTDSSVTRQDGYAYGLYHLSGTVPSQSRNYTIEAKQRYRQDGDSSSYVRMLTNLQVNVVDKQSLREAVATWVNQGLQAADYTSTKWNNFASALSAAARVLGDPTATAAQIASAVSDLNTKGTDLADGRKLCTVTVNHLLRASGTTLTVNGTEYPVTNGYAVITETANFYSGATIRVVPNSYTGYDPPAAPNNEYIFSSNETTNNLNVSFVYTPASGSSTYKSYDISKYDAYYYAPGSGYNYVCEMALSYSSVSNAKAEELLTNSGYTPVGSDFNAGTGGRFVRLGVKYATNPVSRATAFSVLRGRTPGQTPLYSSVNGNTYIPFYAVGSGASSLTPSAVDQIVDLNKGAGGTSLFLYVTGSSEAGPPITSIGMGTLDEMTNNGYTTAKDIDNGTSPVDLNEDAGGEYIYLGYKSTVPTVNKAVLTTLNNVYNDGINYLASHTGSAELTFAMTAAAAILADYTADSWSSTYTEAQISNAVQAVASALDAAGQLPSIEPYDISKYDAYYYAPGSGYNYIYEMGLYYSSDSNSDAESHLRGYGYTPVGGNFNAGVKKSCKYVHLGVKYRSNPNNSATAFRIMVNGNQNQTTVTSEINGNTNVPFYMVGSGASSLTPNVMDGAVDLNKGNGGECLILFASNAAAAGLPITDIAMANNSSSATAESQLTNAGFTIATRFDNVSTYADLNYSAGGDYNYLGYKSVLPQVTDALKRLGSAYNYAAECCNSGSSYYVGLASAMTAAKNILDDYAADSWSYTYTEANINAATKAIMDAMPAMSVGQQYVLSAAAATRRFFKFTPSESGDYIFLTSGVSNSDNDPKIHVLNIDPTYGADTQYAFSVTSGYNIRTYSDDIGPQRANILGVSSYQAYAITSLIANTTYYIDLYLNKAITSIPFQVHKAVDVTFNTTGGTEEKSFVLPAGYNTMKVNASVIGVSRTNHDLVGWSLLSNGRMPKACLASETIAVPSAATTYFALWSPVGSGATALTLNSGADTTATLTAKGQMVFYSFTPSSTGKYVIYSTSSAAEAMEVDPFVIVWEKNALAADPGDNIIEQDDGSGDLRTALGGNTVAVARNFARELTLTAGTEYIFGIKSFHGTTGSGGNVNTTGENCGIGNVKFRLDKVYTVTYNINSGVGTTPAAQSKYYGRVLTLQSGQLTRRGYVFAGWNTASDGSGTSYAAGGAYTANYDVILYAKWNPITVCKVTLDNQGADTAGTAAYWYYYNTVYDGIYYYTNSTCSAPMANDYITVPVKTGYTFRGYYTAPNGNGTKYVDQNGLCINNIYQTCSHDVTLYAYWTANQVTIYWDCVGGAINGQAIVMTYPVFGQTIIFPDSVPVKTGYTFNNWWEDVDDGNQVTGSKIVDFTDDVYFFARWIANTYTVFYNKNADNATGSTEPTQHTYDIRRTLATCGFTRPGYSFVKWNTMPDGSGADYYGNGIVKYMNLTSANGATVTLYAIWKANTYTLRFDKNSEDAVYFGDNPGDDMPDVTVNFGESFVMPYCEFELDGYSFEGWAITPTGAVIYDEGELYSDIAANGVETVTLYAKWAPKSYYIVFNGNGSTSGATHAQIVPFNETVTLYPNGFVKDGYVFAGWAVSKANADNGIVEYADCAPFTMSTKGVTLYAVYREPIKELRADGKYYIEGVPVPAYYGLIEYEGDFYYIKDNAQIVRSKVCSVSKTNGLTFSDGTPIPTGNYEFDADGKMIIKQGIWQDGKYYINGLALPAYYGLVEWEGDFYYIKDNAQIVRSKVCYVNATNGLAFSNGNLIQRAYYEFDEDGKMIIKQGIWSDYRYYINGVAVPSYYGLVLWEGSFYYIKDNAQAVRGKVCQVNTTNGLTFSNGDPIKKGGAYEFDEDGKMIIKQGIWSDYRYYINSVAVPSYYGLVEWEGDFYYIKDNAQAVRGKICQVNNTNGLTFPNGDPIKQGGYYEFDADGKMIIKQGIQADGKYYINGVAVPSYYGLVLWEGDYYYIRDNAQIVRNKTIQVNTTNGLTFPNGDPIPRANFAFDADGKMIY